MKVTANSRVLRALRGKITAALQALGLFGSSPEPLFCFDCIEKF